MTRYISRTSARLIKRVLIAGLILAFILALLSTFERHEYKIIDQNSDSITIISTSSCPKKYQRMINYIAAHLKVKVYVKNDPKIVIRITNAGPNSIKNCRWEIYFSLITIPFQPRFISDKFTVSRVNGFLFKLTPKLFDNSFLFMPKESTDLIALDYRMPSKYFVFPNWFVIGPNLLSVIINSTSAVHHSKMVIVNKTTSSSKRFINNLESFSKETSEPKLVIPTPLHMQGYGPQMEYLTISRDWSVAFNDPELALEAALIEDFLGTKTILNGFNNTRKKVIRLNMVKSLEIADGADVEFGSRQILRSPEAYKIFTFKDSVLLESTSRKGMFYGLQTIMSLCRKNISTYKEKLMPALNITDAPIYKYRGLMIDVARHFLSVDTIFKIIRTMSMYKMNHLHLHLSDDEGWRIEMLTFPELTSVGAQPTAKYGSKPKFDFLNAYLGSIPTHEFKESERQYYTYADYSRILKYAALHHVTIVPELDFPGHSHAALVSMRAKTKLNVLEESDIFNLEDENDTSDDASINDVSDTVINVCRDSALNFMSVAVQTMIHYHKEHQPLKMIHLGGDEVSENALVKSSFCKTLLQNSKSKLRSYVLNTLLKIGLQNHVKVVLWESNHREINFGNISKPIIHFWLPSQDKERIFKRYIDAGMDVIISEARTFYLDHPHESCSHERGLRWATQKIDEFDIFMYSPPQVCSSKEDNCKEMDHILGIQANLWGELIWDSDAAEEMLFPRLLAVAERAWHQAEWQKSFSRKRLLEDWSSFAGALVNWELGLLDSLSIKYRIPPPGTRVNRKGIEYNTLLPGLPVVMSKDNGASWHEFDKQTVKNVLLATQSINGKRRSRHVLLENL